MKGRRILCATNARVAAHLRTFLKECGSFAHKIFPGKHIHLRTQFSQVNHFKTIFFKSVRKCNSTNARITINVFCSRNLHFCIFVKNGIEKNVKCVLNDVKCTAFSCSKMRDVRSWTHVPPSSQSNVARNLHGHVT